MPSRPAVRLRGAKPLFASRMWQLGFVPGDDAVLML
jgi:hypothetical protein